MKITIRNATAVFLLFTLVAPAAAQELKSELTLFGAYRFGGDFSLEESDVSYDAKDSPSYGLIWNTRHKDNTQWEVYFSRQQTEVEASDPFQITPLVDVELYTLQLGGTYLFEGNSVKPYLAMTVGGTHIKTDAGNSESDTFFSMSLGLGFMFRSTERLGFRLEARAHGVFVTDSSELFCRTGPDANFCSFRVEGDMFSQIETFAGATFRF